MDVDGSSEFQVVANFRRTICKIMRVNRCEISVNRKTKLTIIVINIKDMEKCRTYLIDKWLLARKIKNGN